MFILQLHSLSKLKSMKLRLQISVQFPCHDIQNIQMPIPHYFSKPVLCLQTSCAGYSELHASVYQFICITLYFTLLALGYGVISPYNSFFSIPLFDLPFHHTLRLSTDISFREISLPLFFSLQSLLRLEEISLLFNLWLFILFDKRSSRVLLKLSFIVCSSYLFFLL